jgi:hypothetical protein
MASLADQYTYSQTAGFQNQVKQAMISAALAVSAEALAFNRSRTALAISILRPNGLANYLPIFTAAAANDPAVSATIAAGGASSTATDVQIQNAVNAAWNGIANQ